MLDDKVFMSWNEALSIEAQVYLSELSELHGFQVSTANVSYMWKCEIFHFQFHANVEKSKSSSRKIIT